MSDHEWEGVGLYQAIINIIAASTSAVLGVLKLTGGTMAGDIVLSTGLSLNTAVAHVYRAMGPVVRTYTAFGMGAAPPAVVLPTWGGVTCNNASATAVRVHGIYTPVDQTNWSARHRMRIAAVGVRTAAIPGASLKLTGGTDCYGWGIGNTNLYRWKETAGVPAYTVLGANYMSDVNEYEILVPVRASEATAGTVVVTASTDGFAVSLPVDSISLAPAGTGVGCTGLSARFGILHELWSAL